MQLLHAACSFALRPLRSLKDPDLPLPPSADLAVTKTGPARRDSEQQRHLHSSMVLNLGPENAVAASLCRSDSLRE